MKMGKEKKAAVDGPIYDARTLGTPKMLILGVQHLFAMFGATVLVPILTGLSVSATLLFAGLATLFMHLVTGKILLRLPRRLLRCRRLRRRAGSFPG